ncbi:trigger factor [Geitlerinema sp. PCC 7407]|uniref:trigger factor n=1 Tax=Geitlerinema sp. PCC 7407 TaxID=1173025 RepID=UPI00029F8F54|nr:trigger factor [Geitlerinema sp. PCC 7407]AFY64798.1 trigger factor [Geitlerinema sp. PCC 7407]
MKVTQEKLPASQIGLEIEISPDMSKQVYERVVQRFIREANIPGFRKGKVPRHILVQRLGTLRLKATALEDLVQDSLKAALKQENIEAIGNYQLRSSFDELLEQYEPGKALTFSAAVDVQPEVTLKTYTGLTLQAEEVTYDAGRVDTVLEDYRKRMATLVPVEGRPAQSGDVAVVDYAGRYKNDAGEFEEVPGGTAQDFQVDLGEGRFIEGFIDGIVGMSAGETKEIDVKFPADYPQETIAGRDAQFTVTLKEVKEKELPELDDDFAQDVSEFETLAELRESLEKRYREEAEKKTRGNKEQAVLNALVECVEAELPETLILREVDYMLTQTAMQLSNQGMDIKQLFNQDTIPQLRDRSRPEAVLRLKRTLALGEVAKKESIEIEATAVDARVQEVLEQYKGQAQEIDVDQLRAVTEEDMLKEKILTWLIEQSTVELVPEGTLSKAAAEEAEASSETEETPAE